MQLNKYLVVFIRDNKVVAHSIVSAPNENEALQDVAAPKEEVDNVQAILLGSTYIKSTGL